MRPTRLAYLVTHPIQYQAPLLRQVAAQPDIELMAFFASDFSVRSFHDVDFGRAIEWDVPLLDGYAHEVLPQRGRPFQAGEAPNFWRPWGKGLARYLREGRFDALWIHGYHRAAHWQAMLAAKRLGLRVMVRDEATPVSAARSGAKQAIKRGVFLGLDRLVDAWLAIGSLNAAFYRGQGIAETKIFSVPYAVDNAYFQARIAEAAPQRETLRNGLGLEPGRPIVLFAGKLIDRKRPFDLLEAWQQIRDEPATRRPHLLFAGDGPLRSALEARGAHVLGFQSQAQLAALYDLADLFVLPSEREAWGLVVNEAMNAGRAVIVNDRIGAGADLVRGGENGFIYPVGDVAALAVCLRSILGDPARARAMGRRSREIIDGWSFAEDLAGLRAALAAPAAAERRAA